MTIASVFCRIGMMTSDSLSVPRRLHIENFSGIHYNKGGGAGSRYFACSLVNLEVVNGRIARATALLAKISRRILQRGALLQLCEVF